MPFGFDSTYGNGGQNATYTSRFGGGGGTGGGGGGGNLNAQMQAMSSFDPSAMMNVMQQNAHQQWLNQVTSGEAIKKSDRNYAENQATEARNRQSSERARAEQQNRQAASQARSAAEGPMGSQSGFQQAQRYRNMLEMFRRGQTGPQRAVSMIGGPQSQAYGDMARQMAALQASGIPIAEYTGMTELAKALGGSSAEAERAAGQGRLQKSSQDYYDKNRR